MSVGIGGAAKTYTGVLWAVWKEILAPAWFMVSIGNAMHMGTFDFVMFMTTGLTIYLTAILKLEVRPKVNANFTIKPRFVIPDGMDVEDVANMVRNNQEPIRLSDIEATNRSEKRSERGDTGARDE